jgi:hypothetical protein
VTSRFVSNLVLLVLAAVLSATRFALPAGPDRWLTLGAGCAVVVVVAGGFLARGRGPLQRALDLPMAVLGAWTVVSALVLSAPARPWVMLGEAAGIAFLAVTGLMAHEARMEAAVRSGRIPDHSVRADDEGVPRPATATPLSVARRGA